MARIDANAALQLIETNHPGAAPELHDERFKQYLLAARSNVRKRLPLVSDFGGYSALMGGLASDFHDGHIWSTALASWRVVQWPGLVPVRRNGGWFVGAVAADSPHPELKGTQITSCDGTAFDTIAKEEIAFLGGDPSVEAQLISRAPNLLTDMQNPFLKRPIACSFTKGDRTVSITLDWRPIVLTRMLDLLKPSNRTDPEPDGVTAFTGGYWIRLSTLEQPAESVVAAVRQQQASLRLAPKVVIDLRGNKGGDSNYAVSIASLLVGDARAEAAQPPVSSCGGAYWRASKLSLQTINMYRDDAVRQGDAADISDFTKLADEMKLGLHEKRTFVPRLSRCASMLSNMDQDRPSASLPPSLMSGELVLITGHSCFSSCLIATNLFRNIRALHVGETTDRSTRYMEVQEVTLPSGLRTFSTLLKVVVGLNDYGPYQPSIKFSGDMDDTPALKAWVVALDKPH